MGSVLGRITEETPKHTVIADLYKTHQYIVRKYSAIVVAETSMSADGQDNGFRRLARYIGVFGNPENQKVQEQQSGGEKISMTAPVMTMAESDTSGGEKISMTAPVTTNTDNVMAFTLPSKYTLATAPKPTDSSVRLREIPAFTAAVFPYSWNTNPEDAKRKLPSFLDLLTEEHRARVVKEADGSPKWTLNRYNPPWTLPWNKLNEVWIWLEDVEDEH